MKHTHLKVVKELTGLSGCIYEEGEVYEIIQEISPNGVTVRNKEGSVVYISLHSEDNFIPFTPYSNNLKTILE